MLKRNLRAAGKDPRIVRTIDPVPVRTVSRWSIPVRALVLDVLVLVVGMALFVHAMITLELLAHGWQTFAQASGLIIGWILFILFYGGYDSAYMSVGTDEFKRVLSASVALLAAVAALTYVFLPSSAQPPLRLVIPAIVVGSVALLVERWLLRTWLGRQRLAGHFQTTTLVVGELERGGLLVKAFQDDPQAGYQVVAQVEPPPIGAPSNITQAWLDEVGGWIDERQVGAVAIADTGGIDPDLLRQLAWRLEGPRVDLLVSPLLHDVAGPRVSVRPAAGLPLLHLDEPELTGPKRLAKRAVDLCLTIPGLIVLSPLLLVLAVLIKLDSPGPVFYVSARVGQGGTTFGCLKFRTMRVGADAARGDVIGQPDDQIAERYRSDPRITPFGRTLRRWSLDELPQLLNVVAGTMSLVGPRPVLPEELDLLADADLRRHITKPGLTGLWQISGRKEVTWEDRMRMDLYYVEHWSLLLDFVILARTAKAVVVGQGAY